MPSVPSEPNISRRRSRPTDSRGDALVRSQRAGGGGDGDIENDVFDIAVAVFLHAAGVGGDPAAQRGEFHAVGLVAHRHAVFFQLGHDVPADGAGLNAGHHVLVIDPEDAIHPAHIDRNDRAFFVAHGSAARP